MINDVWKDGQMIYYKHPTKNFRVCHKLFSAG